MNRNEILELEDIIGDGSSTPLNKPLIPVSKSTWYRGIKSGLYPRPLRLSPRRRGWHRFQIESLIQDLEAQSYEGPPSAKGAKRASKNGENPL
jgi:prophage regulatory protein